MRPNKALYFLMLGSGVCIACLMSAETSKTYAQKAETNAKGAPTTVKLAWTTVRVRDSIEAAAGTNGLPHATFARLIWAESRFDIKPLSPKGAQFMPGTAEEQGMKSRWTVRLGTQTRIGATRLCNRIRRVGSFCIVRKNR